MDDLIKELVDRAGLSEEQAKAAAEVVVEWVKDEDKRKKILAATVASTVASAVVTGPSDPGTCDRGAARGRKEESRSV